jgi:hypothetical protein
VLVTAAFSIFAPYASFFEQFNNRTKIGALTLGNANPDQGHLFTTTNPATQKNKVTKRQTGRPIS